MRTIPGETAFPAAPSEGERRTGLTKREHFAALALQGLCANPDLNISWEQAAHHAVESADALIAKLNAPLTP